MQMVVMFECDSMKICSEICHVGVKSHTNNVVSTKLLLCFTNVGSVYSILCFCDIALNILGKKENCRQIFFFSQ